MFSMQLAWKVCNLNLSNVEAWIKTNCGTYYTGCSADENQLTLWFSQEPDIDTKNAVQIYWDGLTSASPEATNYVTQTAIVNACNALRAGLISKTWDQMSTAERKIMLGQTPTKSELGL